MGLVDNLNILRKKYPAIWNAYDFSSLDEKEEMKKFHLVNLNNNLSTLYYYDDFQKIFIHSKYDPVREGEKLIKSYHNIEEYDHVFFYGLGLGYHIEEYSKAYPDKEFSVYEPSEFVFYKFLESGDIKRVFTPQLKGFYLESESQDKLFLLKRFVNEHSNKKVLLIFLPSYQRVFKDSFDQFISLFHKIVVEKKESYNTNDAFQKRWIVNSLLNLPYIIQTPNVLHHLDKEKFKNKPALLVAAGPSLQEDIEFIRLIKEKGLAYVFSVGSAINVLLNNGIYPDAACTYDPKAFNYKVFEKVIKSNISEIPLIFGSSVGYETLQYYPGPKAHMITSQDTLAPFLLRLKTGEQLDKVIDAPSIAVITLQMLQKLGFSPIILTGQNLAYKNNKRYASGIEYYDTNNELNSKALEKSLKVEDVYGNVIYTSEVFNRMREQMELFIGKYPQIEVINTTKGGANIKGAAFETIEQVITNRLRERVVEEGWLKAEPRYDFTFMLEKLKELEKEKNKLRTAFRDLIEKFREIDAAVKSSENERIKKSFSKFDKVFTVITKNLFYRIFLLPMNRVQYHLMMQRKNEIKYEKDQVIKGQKVLEEYGKFVYVCEKDFKTVLPLWEKVYVQLSKSSMQ